MAGQQDSEIIITTSGMRARRFAYAGPTAAAAKPLDSTDYRAALRREQAEFGDSPLSVYVHLPFCPSRCLTCDHHSNVTHDRSEIDRYLDDIEREIGLVTEHLGRKRPLQQLHFGGGTPNYLSDTQLVRLVDIIDRHFAFDASTEASIDANAHRASHSQLELLRGLGFSALNLEVRDLEPAVQQALGRAQSMEVVGDVIDSARALGFATVSTDLVYGLPEQSARSIGRTLDKLLSLEPDRIACFSYTPHREAFEHQRAVDNTQLPSLGDKVAMFSRIVDSLCGHGYQWIGLDCFARDDDPITQAQARGELRRNWIGYTVKEGRRVLGFGNSAVSDLSEICVRNHATLERWREQLAAQRLPVCEGETLTPAQRSRRHALSDLICNLRSDAVDHLMGDDADPGILSLLEEGLVAVEEGRVEITESGRFALHRMWGEAQVGGGRAMML